MSDVPSEIFREILVRLPAETLSRCRSVCKTWLHIIDDPSFIKAHANNQVCSHTLLVRNETGAPLYSISLDSLNFIKGPQKIEAIRIKQLIRPGVPRLRDLYYSQVASCNGLVLLSHADIKKIWALWNPLTGECHELPQLNDSLNVDGFGLGYDYDADDYKVVRLENRFYAEKKVVTRTHVYSMKSGLWSMFEGTPRYRELQNPGAFLNGTLYWSRKDSILALDLKTETYSQFSLPTEVIGPGYFILGHLDALDGCLIFSCFNDNFDGWVMKEDGAEKSWMKLFSIAYSSFHDQSRLKLLAYLKSKRQVVLQYYSSFLWFDVDSNSLLKFTIHDYPGINSSQICSSSLVRLNARDTTTGFGAVTARKTSTKKRKRKTEETDSRLTICVRNMEAECCSETFICSEDECCLEEERCVDLI